MLLIRLELFDIVQLGEILIHNTQLQVSELRSLHSNNSIGESCYSDMKKEKKIPQNRFSSPH